MQKELHNHINIANSHIGASMKLSKPKIEWWYRWACKGLFQVIVLVENSTKVINQSLYNVVASYAFTF